MELRNAKLRPDGGICSPPSCRCGRGSAREPLEPARSGSPGFSLPVVCPSVGRIVLRPVWLLLARAQLPAAGWDGAGAARLCPPGSEGLGPSPRESGVAGILGAQPRSIRPGRAPAGGTGGDLPRPGGCCRFPRARLGPGSCSPPPPPLSPQHPGWEIAVRSLFLGRSPPKFPTLLLLRAVPARAVPAGTSLPRR